MLLNTCEIDMRKKFSAIQTACSTRVYRLSPQVARPEIKFPVVSDLARNRSA